MAKVVTIFPWLICLRLPLITPSLASRIMPLVSISVWTPRSFLLSRAAATALGMPPMPSWMQEPSGTMSAMSLPMAASFSVKGRSGVTGGI